MIICISVNIIYELYELYYDNSYHNTFQIILYNTDSEVMSGDDEILLQYKEFNNESSADADNNDGWAAIGALKVAF